MIPKLSSRSQISVTTKMTTFGPMIEDVPFNFLFYLFNVCRLQIFYGTPLKMRSSIIRTKKGRMDVGEPSWIAIIPLDIKMKLKSPGDAFGVLQYRADCRWKMVSIYDHDEICHLINDDKEKMNETGSFAVPTSCRALFNCERAKWAQKNPYTNIPRIIYHKTPWMRMKQKTTLSNERPTMHVDIALFVKKMRQSTIDWLPTICFKTRDYEWIRLFWFGKAIVGICFSLDDVLGWSIRWINSGDSLINRIQLAGCPDAILRAVHEHPLYHRLVFNKGYLEFNSRKFNCYIKRLGLVECYRKYKDTMYFKGQQYLRMQLSDEVMDAVQLGLLNGTDVDCWYCPNDFQMFVLWMYNTFVLQIALKEIVFIDDSTLLFNTDIKHKRYGYYYIAVCEKFVRNKDNEVVWVVQSLCAPTVVKRTLNNNNIDLPKPARTDRRFVRALMLPYNLRFEKFGYIKASRIQVWSKYPNKNKTRLQRTNNDHNDNNNYQDDNKDDEKQSVLPDDYSNTPNGLNELNDGISSLDFSISPTPSILQGHPPLPSLPVLNSTLNANFNSRPNLNSTVNTNNEIKSEEEILNEILQALNKHDDTDYKTNDTYYNDRPTKKGIHVRIGTTELYDLVREQLNQTKVNFFMPALHINCKDLFNIRCCTCIRLDKYKTHIGVAFHLRVPFEQQGVLKIVGVYLQSSLMVKDYRLLGRYFKVDRLQHLPRFDIQSFELFDTPAQDTI